MARKPRQAPTIDRVAEQLVDQARAHGQEAHLVLPPAAAATLLLGTGDPHEHLLRGIAASDDPVDMLQQLFAVQARCLPYLTGVLDPLVDLLGRGSRDGVKRSIAGMLNVLADARLPELVETPGVAGDLLGPIYSLITSQAVRSAQGAFYTPPSVATLMALLGDVQHADSFSDPCCGSGGLAIATVRAMRRAGRRPELVRWHLQDIDPLAVALAGVQLAAHGMPLVTLRCCNSLTDESS